MTPAATNSTPSPREVLRKHWGYSDFRPMQAEIIGSVLAGHDTLGLMATGGGKSITFQVPALIIEGLTLVVTPLISLMTDQVENLLAHGVRAYALHSGLQRRESKLILDRCRLGKARILYLSPEKLTSRGFMEQLAELPVKLITVDEAHCISQWGYDFRPSYLKIGELRKRFPQAPVLALTASATPRVVEDICSKLCFRTGYSTFRLTFSRSNLSYIVRHTDFKENSLLTILSRVPGCGIVYVRSRKKAAAVAQTLADSGISASFYHAGLSPQEKSQRQALWKEGSTRIMVATTAFGMGIDKPDVRIVVHYDPPSSLEEYYQEAGRAGRDGLPSFAVSLVDERTDKGVLTRRLSDSYPPKDYIRELYSKLCVFLNVAMGEGFERVFDFNIGAFCMRYSLQPVAAQSALRILSQAGYIEYVDEVATRARILMLMHRSELYNVTLPAECERIFDHILRNYTGIFADYEYIDEQRIASELSYTERTVYENMLLLNRMHILHYVPRSFTPYVLFTSSRIPESDLILPRAVYEERRSAMQERLEAMKRFLFSPDTCRAATLLRYFGEEPQGECGRCDVCRQNHRHSRDDSRKPETAPDTGATIIHLLRNHPAGLTPSEMERLCGIRSSLIAEKARDMADSGLIEIADGNRLSLPAPTHNKRRR